MPDMIEVAQTADWLLLWWFSLVEAELVVACFAALRNSFASSNDLWNCNIGKL